MAPVSDLGIMPSHTFTSMCLDTDIHANMTALAEAAY